MAFDRGTQRDAEKVRWSLTDLPRAAGTDRAEPADPQFGSSYRILAHAAGVSLVDVSCLWHAGTSYREHFETFGLSLVRRGIFVRHARRIDQIVDSSIAYFEQPGLDQLVSHPLSVIGKTTVIVLSEEAMARYAGD